MSPDHVIPAGNILGEGVQWHADSGLWWTDIQASLLLHLPAGETAVRRVALPQRLGSFAPIAGGDALICAFETGFAAFSPDTGHIDWLHRIEPLGQGRRFNDGRVDRQGRFWAGTMVENNEAESGGTASGALFRLDRNGVLDRMRSAVHIANGLCWSPSGETMYFADSPTRRITAFDFDAATGTPSRPRIFATTPPGAYPDGATVDSEGCMWGAQWGASQIVRYRPDGAIDRIIDLPVSQPTCIAFGGSDLRDLTITTARDGLSADALAGQPLAGDVLIYRVPVAGLPEMRYRPVGE